MALVDSIRNGTTTLFDHHASSDYTEGIPGCDRGSVAGPGYSPRCVMKFRIAVGRQSRMRPSRRSTFHSPPRVGTESCGPAAMFGLHASLTLSGATLQACRAAAPAEAAFHVHVAEHEQDQYDSLAKSNMRVVEEAPEPRHSWPPQHRCPLCARRRRGDRLAQSDPHVGQPSTAVRT